MKRILALVLTAVVLLSILPMVAAADQTATVVGGWLRLRAQPSFDADTITSYYTGSNVTILDGPVNGFYHVRTSDYRTGYMYASYLSYHSSIHPTTNAYVTSANGLNVRLRVGPGINYQIYDSYPVGTPLTVLQSGTYWSKVSIYGVTGYMMSQFIAYSYNPPTPTPTPVCYATIWSENGYGVRMRSGAGTGYSVIGKYPVGTVVSVLKKGVEWDYIQAGSRKGWMMNHFLTYSDANALSSVTINNYTPSVGDTLSVLSISPASATVTYNWLVNGVSCGTGSTYSVAEEDAGKVIQLKVKGTGSYTGTVTSAKTQIVAAATKITAVTLNNNAPVVGTELVPTITPNGANVIYAWYSDGVLVSDAPTYTVSSSDIGSKIYLKVTGVTPYTGTAKSAKTSEVVAIQPIDSVIIYGASSGDINKPYVGDTLTAVYTPTAATVEFQWKKDGAEIAGATTDSYTIASADLGSTISVTVTGINLYSGSKTATTGTVVKVPELPVITTTALPGGVTGNPYSYTLAATSYSTVVWSLAKAPAWLSINTAGLLSGTPTAEEETTITVVATNDDGQVSKDLVLKVTTAPVGTPLLNGTDIAFTLDEGYSSASKVFTLQNTGDGDATDIKYTLQGSDASSFTISGIVTSLAASDTATISVEPVSGLTEGTYNAVLLIEYNTTESITVNISAKVEKALPVLSGDSSVIIFTSVNEGYTASELTPEIVTISNTGNADAINLVAYMVNSDSTADESGHFICTIPSSVAKGCGTILEVLPAAGLTAGTYTTTVVVKADGSNKVKISVTLQVLTSGSSESVPMIPTFVEPSYDNGDDSIPETSSDEIVSNEEANTEEPVVNPPEQLENEETPAEFEDNQSLTVEEQDFNEDASFIPLELNESSNEEE